MTRPTRQNPIDAPPSLRWWLLSGVWLLYMAFGLVATSLAPLVVAIERDLNISHTQMGSVMGIWQLVYILAAIPCGMLLDRLGGRVALLIGGLLVAASALARSFAMDYWGLLFAVMLFGLGGPIISSGAPKVITSLFKGRDRGLAMGIYMTGPALGGVVSLTLTHGLFLPRLDGDWRALLQLWAGFCVFASGVWFVVASRGNTQQLATVQAKDSVKAPSVRSFLQLPAVRLVLAMSVGVFLFNHALNNWLVELIRVGGKSAVEAGYWAAIPTLMGIAGSLLIPRLATPERRFSILLVLCGCAAGASLLLQAESNVSLTVGLLLQGIARTSLMTVLILTLVELPGIGERYVGSASGLFFTAAEVGGVLGPVGLGLFYELTGNFSAGLYALTAVMVAMMLVTLRLRQLARPPDLT